MPDDERGGRYGSTVLVALGWYVTLIAAALTGTHAVPRQPCDGATFGCGLGETLLTVGLVVGGVVVLLPTLLIAGPLSRRLGSAPLAGTFTAFLSVGVVALLALILAGTHR